MRRLVLIALWAGTLALPAHADWRSCARSVVQAFQALTPHNYGDFTQDDWRRTYHDALAAKDDYGARVAALTLIYLNAEKLGMGRVKRMQLGRYLAYLNHPRAVQAGRGKWIPFVTTPGFFKALTYFEQAAQNQDAIGKKLNAAQRVGNVLSALGQDLIWSLGPFAFRAMPGLVFTGMGMLGKKYGAEKIALATGLPVERLDSLLLHSPGHYGAAAYSNFSMFGNYFRNALVATSLFVYGIHPGAWLFESQFQQPVPGEKEWNDRIAKLEEMTTVELAPFRELSRQEGFSTEDKAVKLLINDELWDGWWDRSEEAFRNTDEYRELIARAKSFEIVPFSGGSDMVNKLNATGDEDVLILMNHGTPEPGALSVPNPYLPFPLSQMAASDSAKLIDRVEEKPLKPGAQIFYLVCGFGDCMRKPTSAEQEQWVRLSRKKLNRAGGKAYVSTENILTPVAMDKLRKQLASFATAVGWSLVGPGVFSAGAREAALIEKYKAASRATGTMGYFPSGIRVYDRATEKVKFVDLSGEELNTTE